MQFKKTRAGQDIFDDSPCKCIADDFDINQFTTTYTTREHSWIHERHGGDHVWSYERMYLGIIGDKTATCCEILTNMAAMMIAWDEAVKIARVKGVFTDLHRFFAPGPDPEVAPSFDLRWYDPNKSSRGSQEQVYQEYLLEACGPGYDTDIASSSKELLAEILIAKDLRDGWEGLWDWFEDWPFK
jgi:hypothetical protein